MQLSWHETLNDIASCTNCSLCKGITNKVPGVGNAKAKLMLIGEGPGFYEDRQGEPFVGAAGQLLNKMLASIGLTRQEVYITNAVKCRPPENRTPYLEEIEACKDHLRRQFLLIKPKVVLLLGTSAVKAVLSKDETVTKVRGQVFCKKGIFFIASFHPAALLRDAEKKKLAYQDLLLLRAKLDEIGEDSED